ncbi:YbdK family carboxylate-amine ligase [Paeniglutamicibacter sp. Y32M11]|uniref:carboxylate-amine ligase n=1 Tax=Paeniglutamicibacter sp. Y32M11 TaxID=2853258 RepID=UPI001C532D37|nr:YbdK family carboxylate-amine ligase [Paeniglutamicibacter sp. Y32M11]QXQ08808.1 YbdK family carboxylate-amine ligase [Paeniglutamicibacter sp. Y32M11]
MRSFGVEEEFFLLDSFTGLPTAPTPSTRAELLSLTVEGSTTCGEFLACQLESNSPVLQTGKDAFHTVHAYRSVLSLIARDAGLTVVALGTPPSISGTPAVISPSARYRTINDFCGRITAEHYLSGLHIHVGVEDSTAGVTALNEVRRWLPLLTAIGSNSPYWKGSDSGFASWRSIHYRRWSVQGIPPRFLDATDYARRIQLMMDADAVLDSGHVSWAARLSTRYPTLEIRAADSQMNASNTVLLALIARSLVDASLNGAATGFDPLPEALDLAQWQAAKFGLRGNHINPVDGKSASAAQMLASMMDFILPALRKNGDDQYVIAGLARIMEQGTGAGLQRRHFHEGGFNAVLARAQELITD